MYIFISVIILVLCVLLSIVILVQNPKGGGLTQSLGGVSSQVFGAKNSAGLIDKITWYLALAIMVLCFSSIMFDDSLGGTKSNKSDAEVIGEEVVAQPTLAPIPATEGLV
jgi:preprotein translocase subunit SecG